MCEVELFNKLKVDISINWKAYSEEFPSYYTLAINWNSSNLEKNLQFVVIRTVDRLQLTDWLIIVSNMGEVLTENVVDTTLPSDRFSGIILNCRYSENTYWNKKNTNWPIFATAITKTLSFNSTEVVNKCLT